MKRFATRPVLTTALAASAVLAVAGAPTALAKSASYGPAIGAAGSGPVLKTVGPNGEAATSALRVKLSAADVAALRKHHFTAAMAWHESGTFTQAVTSGANAEFKKLGIKVVSTTQANFDVATQVNQLQTLQTEKPSAVLSLPVNPATETSAYRKLSSSGSKVILLSNVPKGLKWPTGYAGMVTDDLSAMGKQAAQLMGKALHGQGQIGFIYYDANYYVTNERDAAFRTYLKKLYPKIQIVSQQGLADTTKADTLATAMMQAHPGIKGIYVTFSQPPAEGVVAALRGLGNKGVKIVTLDLDPSIDANLCQGNYLAGIVADQPYLLGQTLAKEAGLSLLGKRVPRFSVVNALAVTKSNILSAWQRTLAQRPPANIRSACK